MTRLSVIYPDLPLPPPFPVNNQDASSIENTEIDDLPPEYSTLPPPSEVDDYRPTYIPPLVNEAPADPLQAENTNSGVRTVRKRPARIKMVPKEILVPQFVYNEDQTPVLLPAGNVATVSETTVSVINSVFEVGVATISIIGALFALIFNWRQQRRMERAQKQEQERFEEWQRQGVIPAAETFMPSEEVGKRIRKRESFKRSHTRHWQIEHLD